MLKRLFKRFSQDLGEQRAETIRSWAGKQAGVVAIDDVRPREVARVCGVVELLRVRPREGRESFEAVVSDGTGTVTAVWLGRSALSGLSIGTRIFLNGRFGGERGSLHVMNPEFEFAPGER
ncbi:MAG TPA: OB-fold nucleic acid binding domain-containing protein [Actinomycetota bacterium]